MKCHFAPARKAFQEVRTQWDELNASRGNHILLDSLFVDCALRYFGDDSILLGAKNETRKPGLALFKKKGIGFWETFQPSQAPIGLILFSEGIEVRDELAGLMRSLPGFALQLSVLQQDPDYAIVPPEIEHQRFEIVNYIETAQLPVAGTFEQYWKARSINLRHNVSRRRRRLIEKGFVPELVTLRNVADMSDALKTYATLESKGWKAQGGTAVTLDNAQGQFYHQVLDGFCQRGEAVVYQFRASGQVIATDLCLTRNDMLIFLKTTYDEDWNEFSPARLMREEIMKQLFAEGRVHRVEFYGRVMDWHKQWTDNVRTMYHVNCFRPAWVRPLKAFIRRIKSKESMQAEQAAPRQSIDGDTKG
jgi:hypothetical protein